MSVLLGVVGLATPGAVLGLILPDEPKHVLQWAARCLGLSILGAVVVGFILQRVGLFSPELTLGLTVVLAGFAAVALRGRLTGTLRSLSDVSILKGVFALAVLLTPVALRWLIYERRSPYPLGWDAGVNFSYVAYLERMGRFPTYRLAEPLINGYPQAVFIPASVLDGALPASSFTDFKAFQCISIAFLLVSAAHACQALLAVPRQTPLMPAAVAVGFGAFLVNSPHLAMTLAIGMTLLTVGETATWRSLDGGRLLFLFAAGFAIVALHPPTAQVAGLVSLFWGASEAGRDRSRGLAILGLGLLSLSIGVLLHAGLAPTLTSAAAQYASEQVQVIDQGGEGVNAADVQSGEMRKNLPDLVMWLLPAAAAGFVGVGTIGLFRERNWSIIAICAAFVAPTMVKILPTNGREYLLLLYPLSIAAAAGVMSISRMISLNNKVDLALVGALVSLIPLIGIVHTAGVASDPEVGPVAYIDLSYSDLAEQVRVTVGSKSVLAARYLPGHALVEAISGNRVLGGSPTFGGDHRVVESSLDSGPTAEATSALCDLGASHVLLNNDDRSAPAWEAADLPRSTLGSYILHRLPCPDK